MTVHHLQVSLCERHPCLQRRLRNTLCRKTLPQQWSKFNSNHPCRGIYPTACLCGRCSRFRNQGCTWGSVHEVEWGTTGDSRCVLKRDFVSRLSSSSSLEQPLRHLLYGGIRSIHCPAWVASLPACWDDRLGGYSRTGLHQRWRFERTLWSSRCNVGESTGDISCT